MHNRPDVVTIRKIVAASGTNVDGNKVCTRYEYDAKGRLTDAFFDNDIACFDDNDGLQYHQEYNGNGTVDYAFDPNGSSSISRY